MDGRGGEEVGDEEGDEGDDGTIQKNEDRLSVEE